MGESLRPADLKAQDGFRRVVRESRIRSEAAAAGRAVVMLRKAVEGFVDDPMNPLTVKEEFQEILTRLYVPHALAAVQVEAARYVSPGVFDIEFTAKLVEGVTPSRRKR